MIYFKLLIAVSLSISLQAVYAQEDTQDQGPQASPTNSPQTSTKEQDIEKIIALESEKERLKRLFSPLKLMSSFHIGASFMPEYNEEGDNQGFEETNFFARLNLDSRHDFKEPAFLKPKSIQMGVNIDFYSANVVNCETLEGDDKTNCEKETPSINSLSFNDVSNTVDASLYLWSNFNPMNIFDYSEIGVGFKYGYLSREKLKANGDSINDYHGFGLRYAYNDYKRQNHWKPEPGSTDYINNYQNGIPRFFLEYHYLKVEDFAGLGISQNRHVSVAAYRIKETSPIYLGLVTNGGSGPDVIALTLTYGLNPESLIDFL